MSRVIKGKADVSLAAVSALAMVACAGRAAPPAQSATQPASPPATVEAPTSEVKSLQIEDVVLEKDNGALRLHVRYPLIRHPSKAVTERLAAEVNAAGELRSFESAEASTYGDINVDCTATIATESLVSVVCSRAYFVSSHHHEPGEDGGAGMGQPTEIHLWALEGDRLSPLGPPDIFAEGSLPALRIACHAHDENPAMQLCDDDATFARVALSRDQLLLYGSLPMYSVSIPYEEVAAAFRPAMLRRTGWEPSAEE